MREGRSHNILEKKQETWRYSRISERDDGKQQEGSSRVGRAGEWEQQEGKIKVDLEKK